jgi:hypothetical protein
MAIPWNMADTESVMKAKCLSFRKTDEHNCAPTSIFTGLYWTTCWNPLKRTTTQSWIIRLELRFSQPLLWRTTPCSPVEINVSD